MVNSKYKQNNSLENDILIERNMQMQLDSVLNVCLHFNSKETLLKTYKSYEIILVSNTKFIKICKLLTMGPSLKSEIEICVHMLK